MLLILYGILAFLPLLGIVWIFTQGSITTVDGLFMSLICLTISGIFGTTALFELRQKKGAKASGSSAGGRSITSAVGPSGGSVQQGRVENVQFFESHVGQPNHSIITLSDGGSASRLLLFEGDLRNALPIGKKVKIFSLFQDGRNVLQEVQWA